MHKIEFSFLTKWKIRILQCKCAEKADNVFFNVTTYMAGLVLVMDIMFCHKIFTNG